MFSGSRIGNQETTRCIGNYLVKGGYKDFEDLAAACGEPVIAEPEVHGGIPIDEASSFLLLMSDGLYKSLQEATGCVESVNKEIAQIAVEQVNGAIFSPPLSLSLFLLSNNLFDSV